jgi:hypothetical protein
VENDSEYKPKLGSYSFMILVGVCAFFVWTQYEIYQSALFSGDLIRNFGTYSELMKIPWWIATFYSSELGGSIGGTMRWIASFLALYCAFVYWRNGSPSFSKIKGKLGMALLFEAVYFLFLIPSVFLGFVFPITAGKVWYFEVTPVPEVFFVAGVACLAMVLVIPPALLKLRSAILSNKQKSTLMKWGWITVLAYLFVVFWFNSAMQWTGMIATWGTEILSDLWNLSGFISSAVFMLVVALLAARTLLPTIKNESVQLKPSRIVVLAVAFGGYFLFATAVYFAAGGFASHPTAWYELIVPHNPYAWCLIFFFAGIPLLAKFRRK